MPSRDDPLQDECRDFIEKLRGAKDTAWHDQVVVGWIRTSNVPGLRMLHEALRDVESDTSVPPGAVSSLSWSIEQGLAFIPHGHGVEALVDLSSRPSPGLKEPSDILRRWQRVAWVLANQQSLSTLLATLGQRPTPYGAIELLASWMHECVARGHSLEEAEPARRLQELLVAVSGLRIGRGTFGEHGPTRSSAVSVKCPHPSIRSPALVRGFPAHLCSAGRWKAIVAQAQPDWTRRPPWDRPRKASRQPHQDRGKARRLRPSQSQDGTVTSTWGSSVRAAWGECSLPMIPGCAAR